MRLWHLLIDTAVLQEGMQGLQWHLGTVFGQTDLIQHTDGGKPLDIPLFLKFLTLPERGEDAAGGGQRAALEGDHVDLHEMAKEVCRV